MRWTLLCLVGFLSLGCDGRQPKISDEVMQKFRTENPGMIEACLDKIRWGGFEADIPEAVDQCFVMTEPRRWRGYWRAGLETSLFCPAPAGNCPVSDDTIWLTFADPKLAKRGDEWGLYAVDFVGRLTVHKGMFGHLGLADREMIVDQMVSIHEVKE